MRFQWTYTQTFRSWPDALRAAMHAAKLGFATIVRPNADLTGYEVAAESPE